MTPQEIKALRKAYGDTQQAFADRLSVARMTIWRWERIGKKGAVPTRLALKALQRLAKKRGITLSD